MADDIVLLRHAGKLLGEGDTPHAVITKLFTCFHVEQSEAIAAVAAAILLTERGVPFTVTH